ncbi:MAG TPA: hypothetical protein DEP43_07745 [Ruminococcaceae bacterium]|nr:hypothetical protein [Oscillospiraceae bacterium]HCB65832.1 hypothetical protein [Oscillospiraceae bacterium]
MPEQNAQKQKTRFFILAFALSFCVLALMGLIVVFMLNPAEAEPSGQVSADTFYLPREEDNLSVLITCQNPDAADGVFFALVRLDILGGHIPVILFPHQVILDAETGYETLFAAYQTGGPQAAAEALSASFSIPIDRYVNADSQDIIDAINRIGAAEYDLDKTLSWDENGIFINLSDGRQLVDGQKFWDILRYPGYQESGLEQCREGAQLIASYINSRLFAFLGQNAEALVSGLLNLVETDLSYLDFESRLPALTFLSKLSGDPAQAYTLTGGWNRDGQFVPDAAAHRQLVQVFS